MFKRFAQWQEFDKTPAAQALHREREEQQKELARFIWVPIFFAVLSVGLLMIERTPIVVGVGTVSSVIGFVSGIAVVFLSMRDNLRISRRARAAFKEFRAERNASQN